MTAREHRDHLHKQTRAHVIEARLREIALATALRAPNCGELIEERARLEADLRDLFEMPNPTPEPK